VQPWDEAFRELREEFVTSSRERLAGMGRLAAVLERNPGDRATRDALRRDFHGLAGSGTTYGFPRVTELGLEGEQRLRPLEDGTAPPLSERDLAELRALLERVRSALEAGVGSA
jgi:chemotaxis protein histidine kinase CheA